MTNDRDSKLFDVSHTTSKISKLIDRVRGYRAEEHEEDAANLKDSSRWDNLKDKLSDKGDFQAAEDSEIESVEERLSQQFNRDEDEE